MWRRWIVVGMLGCAGGADTDDSDDGEVLTFRPHPCGSGDPVTRTCPTGVASVDVPDPDWPDCAAEGIAAGDTCDVPDDRCVIQPANACEDDPDTVINSAAYLWCRAEPFEDTPCPQSRRAIKEGVQYLTSDRRAAAAEAVLQLPLASFRYREGAGPGGEQLGFVIDDAPDAPFLDAAGERVNLYAYVSSVVAAVQEQQAHIARLEAELEAQRSAAVCSDPTAAPPGGTPTTAQP